MANLENQKVLRIGSNNKANNSPQFITEDVIEVQRAKLVYYKWLSRLMGLLATMSLLLGVCTTLSIMKLAPEIMIDPQIFVNMSDSQSIVKREFVNSQMESREKMMINFIKQYIEMRNSYIIDEKEMVNRWAWGGIVSYLSTVKVYKKFAEEYPRVKEELDKKRASRSVEILFVRRTGGEKSNTWEVEFKTYDYTYNKEELGRLSDVEPTIIEKYWTVTVRGLINSRRIISFKRLINPLGFIISSYSQSEIKV